MIMFDETDKAIAMLTFAGIAFLLAARLIVYSLTGA